MKEHLIEKCKEILEGRINIAKSRINDLQNASNEETKSSAGDKYETGRAMMQIEKDKAASQLVEILKQKKVLDQIQIQKSTDTIGLGSIVFTDKGNFFLCVAIGEVTQNGITYFSISPVSPLGKELLNKKTDEIITINNRSLKILKVY